MILHQFVRRLKYFSNFDDRSLSLWLRGSKLDENENWMNSIIFTLVAPDEIWKLVFSRQTNNYTHANSAGIVKLINYNFLFYLNKLLLRPLIERIACNFQKAFSMVFWRVIEKNQHWSLFHKIYWRELKRQLKEQPLLCRFHYTVNCRICEWCKMFKFWR